MFSEEDKGKGHKFWLIMSIQFPNFDMLVLKKEKKKEENWSCVKKRRNPLLCDIHRYGGNCSCRCLHQSKFHEQKIVAE